MVKAVLPTALGSGGSRPPQVLADDGRRYWLKPVSNPQNPRVPINEQVVGRCGALIAAPTCLVALVGIPTELATYVLPDGRQLGADLAHGSCDVSSAQSDGMLIDRPRDDNGWRHLMAHILYDWCHGSDQQFLYDNADDRRVFSHDHGHYFPHGPGWTESSLSSGIDIPCLISGVHDRFEDALVDRASDALASVSRDQLVAVLGLIPASLPVTDHELVSLGYFLEHRLLRIRAEIRRYSSH